MSCTWVFAWHSLRQEIPGLRHDGEWRQPIADRLVLKLFNKRMLAEYDFQEDAGDGVFLNEEGFRKFCKEYERWMAEPNFCNKVGGF